MTATVTDARPPMAVVRVLNPILRLSLRTPVSRLVKPFALLEFTGRRSGRPFRVPVGWHEVDDRALVLTPAPWRANFDGGRRVTVRRHGRAVQMIGTLVTDPERVAAAITSLLRAGGVPRDLGLTIPDGHQVTAADVIAVDRAIIELCPLP